jgi:hypothetical protein
MNADPATEMRERLRPMRASLVASLLRNGYSSGAGRMLGELATTIAALDTVACSDSAIDTPATLPATGERAIVADDNRTITLTLYRGREALAAAEIEPAHAIQIAGELLAAARRRLSWRGSDV